MLEKRLLLQGDREAILEQRPVHPLFINANAQVTNLGQQYLLLKPAALRGLVPADGFHFLHGTAPRNGDGPDDLQQVGQFLHGFALLILCQFFVQLFVQFGEVFFIR